MSDVKTLLHFPETLEAVEKGQLEAHKLGIEDAYKICQCCLIELRKIGWEADYDLSGELFNLRRK